ncbi:MAG: AtpZ/AtpI family protein [Gemmatimonadetes bacterium]|nr:AtpZ/AtpI family protein [Gemmatimonadota bacterium]
MAERRGVGARGGPEGQRLVAEAGRYLGHGLTWALSTALFLFLGWLLDRWLGTVPLFMVLGAVVGAGAGFYSMYYHLVIEPRERARREREEGEE